MFIGGAVLFERVFIFDRVIEGPLETCADFLSIVFSETVLSVCGVDPSNLCRSLGPDRFAIHVCVEGLEVWKDSTFQFAGFNCAPDADNDFDAVKSVTLFGGEGNSMEECTEVNCAYGKCIDVVEGRLCRYCAVVRVDKLKCFVVADFSEHLCSKLVDCVSDGAVVGDAEAEFLGVIGLVVVRCLGAFAGLFIVVVSVGTVVMVVTSVVVLRGRGWFIVGVGWVSVEIWVGGE